MDNIISNLNRIVIFIVLICIFTDTKSYCILMERIDLESNTYKYDDSIIDEKAEKDELQYTEEYLKYIESTEDEKKEFEIKPAMYDIPIFQNKNEEKETKEIEAKDIPASENYYKIQNIRVENQANSGWCWAYASLKCLETFLMKKDGIGSNENYNFAEYHLAYMKYKNFNEESGWKDLSEIDSEEIYAKGGNFDDFLKYAGILSKNIEQGNIQTNFKILGPVSGYDVDNHSYNDLDCEQFKDKEPEYKISKVKQFSKIKKEYDSEGVVSNYKDSMGNDISDAIMSEFRNEVKDHIINKSAIFAYVNTNSSKFNKDNKSLYVNDNSLKINHAVTIVGWDDKYQKENFNNEPKHNGAWIALNSWGDDNDSTDEGYIYISYDDAIVEQYLYGILEVTPYKSSPNLDISYEENDNKITAIVTSNQKIIVPDDTWEISYIEKEIKDYYTVFQTKTILKKEYYERKKEMIEFKDLSKSVVKLEVNVEGYFDKKNIYQGDINFDKNTNIIDLLFLKRHIIAGENEKWILKEGKFKAADMNSDNKLDIIDLLLLKRKINKINVT